MRNDPVIAHSIHTGMQSYLFHVVNCGSEKKTVEICRELAYILIKEIKEKYKVDVFAICSDKIENKIKTLRKLIENDYPHILTHGCSAHFLNLLESVVTLKNIIKHIVEVQKYFRNYHQPHGWWI